MRSRGKSKESLHTHYTIDHNIHPSHATLFCEKTVFATESERTYTLSPGVHPVLTRVVMVAGSVCIDCIWYHLSETKANEKSEMKNEARGAETKRMLTSSAFFFPFARILSFLSTLVFKSFRLERMALFLSPTVTQALTMLRRSCSSLTLRSLFRARCAIRQLVQSKHSSTDSVTEFIRLCKRQDHPTTHSEPILQNSVRIVDPVALVFEALHEIIC